MCTSRAPERHSAVRCVRGAVLWRPAEAEAASETGRLPALGGSGGWPGRLRAPLRGICRVR